MTSSETGSRGRPGVFTRSLASPVPSAPTGMMNPPTLDGFPNLVVVGRPGAVKYDVHVDYPNGTSRT